MTKPLPCPFCGYVGVTHREGSTFRWLTTECTGCGAQCGEERINTLSTDRGAAIEQAKEAAIKTWNTRAALEQQQAEPKAQSDLIKRLRHTASKGVSVWGDLQMAAAREIEILTAEREPVAWAVQGCSKMWRGEFAEIDAKAEAKRIGGTCVAYALYTAPPQRPWVGLEAEEILDMFDVNNVYGSKWIEFARTVEAKLKAKNDY